MSEQPMPTAGYRDVTPAARDTFLLLLAEQDRKGIAAYGVTLQAGNGRDAVQDALEEMVDAFKYVVQSGIEREQLRAENERLRAALVAADALADWVGWWLSARREEEASKFSEMRKRLDAYRAASSAGDAADDGGAR